VSVERARQLRLAGRWDEALRALEGDDTRDAAVERVLTLADENMLARDRSAEIEAALQGLEQRGDPGLQAFAVARRGLALHAAFLRDRSKGEPPEELPLFERALAMRRELGDERGVAESLFHVGLVHQVVRGDSETSRPFFQESYDRAQQLGDEVLMSYAIRHVAFCDQEAGHLERAEAGFRESLALRERAGWVPGVAAAQLALALLLGEQGRRDQAVALAGQAREGFERLGAERYAALARDELGALLGRMNA
jgi:tetratricopeptide (TPR) repeat protein